MPALPAPTCSEHPAEPAGWECTACARRLCPACAACVERETGATHLVCCLCRGAAVQLLVPGEPDAFHAVLRTHLLAPVGVMDAALLLVLVLGVRALAGVGFDETPQAWVARLLVAGGSALAGALAFFSLLHAAARGLDELSGRVAVKLRELLGPAVPAALLALLVVLPPLAFAWRLGAHAPAALLHSAVWAWLGASALAVPVGVLALATGRPLEVLGEAPRWVREVRGPYLTCALLLVPLFGWPYLLATVGQSLRGAAGLGPLLAFLALGGLNVVAVARLHGALLRVAAPALGYGLPSSVLRPALGAHVPHGTPPPAPERLARERRAALELPPPERPALQELAERLAARDWAAALPLYARLGDEVGAALGVPSYLALGLAAARRGDVALAARALAEAGTRQPAHPEAPRALVLLGRLQQERLGDAAAARRTFERVVAAYPGTEAARVAAARLAGG